MGSIVTLKTADASILCLIILVFIYIENRMRSDRSLLSYKLFSKLVLVNIIMICVDMLSWAFDGKPGAEYQFLNDAINFLLFLGGPIAPAAWLFYLYTFIYNDRKKTVKAMYYTLIPIGLNTALSIASLFTGWFFYTDAMNVYNRGSLYFLHPSICYCIMLFSILLVLVNKKRVDKSHFLTLLLFFIPALLGTGIQVCFYGYSLTWVVMALSILVVFINIQNTALHTDFLTDAYNLRRLQAFLAAKSGMGKQFSAIMLDFDQLKSINDNYGHSAGDEALVELVKIIKKVIRKNDFVARTGGDEFIIILGTVKEETLNKVRDRILVGIDEFNLTYGKQYSLGVSLGYGVYDTESGLSHNGFLRKLDSMMYADKRTRRAAHARA
jgi:diguanylate cyclase (GGDEF)-like protein